MAYFEHYPSEKANLLGWTLSPQSQPNQRCCPNLRKGLT